MFTSSIEVYEKEEKYSCTCVNTIVIHYTFQMPDYGKVILRNPPATKSNGENAS